MSHVVTEPGPAFCLCAKTMVQISCAGTVPLFSLHTCLFSTNSSIFEISSLQPSSVTVQPFTCTLYVRPGGKPQRPVFRVFRLKYALVYSNDFYFNLYKDFAVKMAMHVHVASRYLHT